MLIWTRSLTINTTILRCDISYDGVKRFSPAYCENYYSADLTKTLRINVDKALSQLQAPGVDAAIVSIYRVSQCYYRVSQYYYRVSQN